MINGAGVYGADPAFPVQKRLLVGRVILVVFRSGLFLFKLAFQPGRKDVLRNMYVPKLRCFLSKLRCTFKTEPKGKKIIVPFLFPYVQLKFHVRSGDKRRKKELTSESSLEGLTSPRRFGAFQPPGFLFECLK